MRCLASAVGWRCASYHGFHIPFEIDLLAGGLAASIFGVIFGLPALRMRGLYFALITLMIAGAFQVFINAIELPRRRSGLERQGLCRRCGNSCRIRRWRQAMPLISATSSLWSRSALC